MNKRLRSWLKPVVSVVVKGYDAAYYAAQFAHVFLDPRLGDESVYG